MNEVMLKLLSAVAAISFLFSGCATPMQIHDVEQLNPDQIITFGKLELVKDGKVQPWSSSSFWKGITEGRLIILPPDGNKAIVYKIDKDGYFYWGLAPGEYLILGFDISSGYETTGGDLRIGFTVNSEIQNNYIGNLIVEMGNHMYKPGIYDDFTKAVEIFNSKFPNAPQPVKNLAQLPEDLGTCEKTIFACNDVWGVDCSNSAYGVGFRRFEGITPIYPEVSLGQWLLINTLQPSFEWQPSSRNDVSYDLVIYEAASYSTLGIDTHYVPGRLLIFQENLKEPRYSLDHPLQPKSKYYWSVRLRQSNNVSTWSKYTYFQTILLVTKGAGSQWFRFETPEK